MQFTLLETLADMGAKPIATAAKARRTMIEAYIFVTDRSRNDMCARRVISDYSKESDILCQYSQFMLLNILDPRMRPDMTHFIEKEKDCFCANF